MSTTLVGSSIHSAFLFGSHGSSEETSEDVRSRIQTIQENEILQLRELTNFLDIQLNFARQYVDVLNEVKLGWCDELVLLGGLSTCH